mgnify:CR=1 FL=1|jgi:hypothetical protein
MAATEGIELQGKDGAQSERLSGEITRAGKVKMFEGGRPEVIEDQEKAGLHIKPIEEVFQMLNTSAEGLTKQKSELMQEQQGPNCITPPATRSECAK